MSHPKILSCLQLFVESQHCKVCIPESLMNANVGHITQICPIITDSEPTTGISDQYCNIQWQNQCFKFVERNVIHNHFA